MSADPTANLQLFSPPGSGRSSPVPRAARSAAEDCTSTLLVVLERRERRTRTRTKRVTHADRPLQLSIKKTKAFDDMLPASSAHSPSGTLPSRNGPTIFPSSQGCSRSGKPSLRLRVYAWLTCASCRLSKRTQPKHQSSHKATRSHCAWPSA
jgi:hypothetical protein